MIYLIIYLILGIAFDLFMEWVITLLEKINEEDMSHLRFNNREKALNLIVWPYYLFMFTYGFFKNTEE